jgi:hypothetical protein
MNEAENTFRALKDQEPLITRLMCYFGKHKWTKFSEPVEEKRGLYIHCIQKRYCAGCGLYDLKQLWKH